MNNTFNGLISRLDIAKERISKLKDMSIEIPKLKWKEKKIILKSSTEYPRSVEQLQKVELEYKKKNETKEKKQWTMRN